MSKETIIRLPYPPSTNHLYARRKGGGVRKAEKYVKWIKHAGAELMIQRPREHTGHVSILLVAIKPDRRRRDVANLEKAVLDLLVRHHVIEDDSLVQSITLQWDSRDLEPGVSVTITPLAEAAKIKREG